MKIFLFKENGYWKLNIIDVDDVIISKHDLDEDFTTDDVLNLVKLLNKISNFEIHVNFTHKGNK